jgi:ABC-type sulfate transport system substrate-binding protein
MTAISLNKNYITNFLKNVEIFALGTQLQIVDFVETGFTAHCYMIFIKRQ